MREQLEELLIELTRLKDVENTLRAARTKYLNTEALRRNEKLSVYIHDKILQKETLINHWADTL